MAVRLRQVSGPAYLELVTTLLHRMRLAHPTAGVWEAADLQWWWRRDQHADPAGALFWLDEDVPVAASILTNWGDYWGCDIVRAGDDVVGLTDIVWPQTIEQIETVADGLVDMTIRDDDPDLIDAALAAGFEAVDENGLAMWMPAAERRQPSDLPDGFELVARTERATTPHHLIRRSGADVAARLAECSLYRPELDLAICDPHGEVAAYGLFWADPVTRVGLVEPMRTEDRFQGRGLARHLLAVGLDRLTAAGCTRCKVSPVNREVPMRLYLGAGFRPGATDRTYRKG